MSRRLLLAAFASFALALAAGCQPQVGDACLSDIKCDRGQVCDTASPAGYCLRYDCLSDRCPKEAVCVDFTILSACMRRCSNDGDCRGRDGYVCRDDIGQVPFCYTPTALD